MAFHSLVRQTLRPDVWIIADDLQFLRMDEVTEHAKDAIRRKVGPRSVEHFEPREKPEGYYSDLPGIYNQMIGRAIDHGCDIAISLQDYIWIPSFGLEMFAAAAEGLPGDLVAGLCSMLREPGVDKVADPLGKWTIFEEPWPHSIESFDRDVTPEDIEWYDVRAKIYRGPGLHQSDPRNWEMNWAMFPLDVCRDGVLFDEDYGRHIGHENVQFAWDCHLKKGRNVWVQTENHALSLPHRHYFPTEWEDQQSHREENMLYHAGLYGQVERLRTGELG